VGKVGRDSVGAVAQLHVRVQAYRLLIGEAVAAAIQDIVHPPVIADTTGPTQAHRASHRPDVVIVIGSRIDSSTTAAVRTARRRWRQSMVIALTETELVDEGVALVQQGADAWVSPNEGVDVLRSLLIRIAAGERVLLPPAALARIASTLSETATDPAGAGRTLTSRESQVLECFAKGLSRGEIADLLHISRATLRTHVQNILRKLDLHSINQAASLAAGEATGPSSAMGFGESRDLPAATGAPTHT
jgi:DNA-binding NarL/FixJ family response regulator